jgi:glycolate oxidase
VGSEGTLAVITAVTLRLIPKPASKKTMVAFFKDVPPAAQTVSNIIRNKIVPTTLEFMDGPSINCVRDEMGLPAPSNAGALLLIEVDGDEDLATREAEKVREICIHSGAIHFQAASGREEVERLWEARRNISLSLSKLAPAKVSEDIVVPRSRLAELVSFLDRLGRKHELPIAAFGHAGDGNIHVNIMLDKDNASEVRSANAAVEGLFRKVIEMGGTISGEHGIGITKAPYVGMEITSPALELMLRLKKAFDPSGILNPGKIFP